MGYSISKQGKLQQGSTRIRYKIVELMKTQDGYQWVEVDDSQISGSNDATSLPQWLSFYSAVPNVIAVLFECEKDDERD
jgi:hypothetical protein